MLMSIMNSEYFPDTNWEAGLPDWAQHPGPGNRAHSGSILHIMIGNPQHFCCWCYKSKRDSFRIGEMWLIALCVLTAETFRWSHVDAALQKDKLKFFLRPLNKLVSLANEVQSYHLEKKKEVSSFSKSPVIGGLSAEPSLYDILSYSYCYVGIMTGMSIKLKGLTLSSSSPLYTEAWSLCVKIVFYVLWFDVIFTFASCFNSCSLFVSLSLPHVQYRVSPYSFFTNKFARILSNSFTCFPASFLFHYPLHLLSCKSTVFLHCAGGVCVYNPPHSLFLSTLSSPSLYLIPPCCPQRALLPLPNLRGLAGAAPPPCPARRRPLLTEAEAGPRLWSPVRGCQLGLPPGLRPHGWLPQPQLLLQVWGPGRDTSRHCAWL